MILALAVSDLAVSLNRLLAAGPRVRWDWLTPAAGLVVFLKIVTQWWGWFGAAPLAGSITFGMFLGVLSSTVLLFLLASAAFPDAVEAERIDLRACYARVARRFWLLFAAQWLVAQVTTLWIETRAGHARLALGWSAAYLVAPAAILLAFVGNRLLHAFGLAALILLYVQASVTHTLGQ